MNADEHSYTASDLFRRLSAHFECSEIQIAYYGNAENIALECIDCGVVIIDADNPAIRKEQ